MRPQYEDRAERGTKSRDGRLTRMHVLLRPQLGGEDLLEHYEPMSRYHFPLICAKATGLRLLLLELVAEANA
jgi:hypothetical protein